MLNAIIIEQSMSEKIKYLPLIERINTILNETKLDINLGAEHVYKEHCNEVRRQVQLAKETQILKIEDNNTELMNKIDKFHKIQTNDNDDKTISEEETELKSFINQIKKILNQTQFDITDSELFIHKEHKLCAKYPKRLKYKRSKRWLANS